MKDHKVDSQVSRQRILDILDRLHTFEADERQRAMNELARLDRVSALYLLVELARDTNSRVRTDATRAILLLDRERGIPLMIPLLEDARDSIRWNVCGLFSGYGDERVVEPLSRVILNDPDGDVRHIACFALEKVGDARALPALRWVQQHDEGTDFEGRRVSDMAEEAIKSILQRQPAGG